MPRFRSGPRGGGGRGVKRGGRDVASVGRRSPDRRRVEESRCPFRERAERF